MLYFIVKSKLYKEDFILSRTEGFENFLKEIEKLDVDHLAKVAGVDKQKVKEAAIAYATAKNSMEFHGLGVTEQEQGSKTVMLIADLAMITGNIGRRGVGVNPLRGQNNVQGAADMGCQPHQGAGYKAGPELLKSLGAKVIAIGIKPNGLNINKKCGSTFPRDRKSVV